MTTLAEILQAIRDLPKSDLDTAIHNAWIAYTYNENTAEDWRIYNELRLLQNLSDVQYRLRVLENKQ